MIDGGEFWFVAVGDDFDVENLGQFDRPAINYLSALDFVFALDRETDNE